jgi:hypothetical protein
LYWIFLNAEVTWTDQTRKVACKTSSCKRPWRPTEVTDVEAPIFSRKSAQRHVSFEIALLVRVMKSFYYRIVHKAVVSKRLPTFKELFEYRNWFWFKI